MLLLPLLDSWIDTEKATEQFAVAVVVCSMLLIVIVHVDFHHNHIHNLQQRKQQQWIVVVVGDDGFEAHPYTVADGIARKVFEEMPHWTLLLPQEPCTEFELQLQEL